MRAHLPLLQDPDGNGLPAGDLLSGDLDPLVLSVGLALLVLASFSANASAALLVYSPTKLARRLGEEAAAAPLELLRAHDLEYRLLARLLMIGGCTAGLLAADVAGSGSLGRGVFVATCVVAAFLVAVLPATPAERGAERIVLRALPILSPLRVVLSFPILRPMIAICRPLLRALRIPDKPPTEPDEIADEILAAVADSAGEDELEEEEKVWIGNIVELKELHASEAMTPRTDIHGLEAGTSLREAVQRAVEKGHSRLPVYDGTIDNVVGIFYAKDVLGRLAREEDTDSVTVGEVTREALFAPESMRISHLLQEFKQSKVQMAIVLDEYGGTAGLITIEDVLEEIVGDIADEFDPEEELPIEVIEDRRVIEVSGKTRVEEANDALHEDLVPEGEDYDTVGGFVFHHLGQIPEAGETLRTGGLEYKILQVEGRRIRRLRLTLLEPQPSDT